MAINLLIVLFFSARSTADAADFASALISSFLEYCNCSIDNTWDEYPLPEKAGLPKPKVSCSDCADVITNMVNRVQTMNNDLVKIDTLLSHVMGVKPNVDRIAANEGKEDARRD